jgi:integrase
MHSILRKALEQAVLDRLILRNVCEAVKPPKVERKEISPLDRQQAKALIEAASGDRLEALHVLAVHTGMREGELLGLKWEDVDLERGLLRLRHALVREGGKVVLGDLKTSKSRRSVRLTAVATEALRGHLERQLAEMERVGSSCDFGDTKTKTRPNGGRIEAKWRHKQHKFSASSQDKALPYSFISSRAPQGRAKKSAERRRKELSAPTDRGRDEDENSVQKTAQAPRA